MSERLFGMETEYAFAHRMRAESGPGPARHELLDHLQGLAARTLPHLPGMRSAGIFLVNGSRLYRDPTQGFAHLELAGPECGNPWDVVRYLLAGERQLADLASALLRERPEVAEAAFNKSNVDYSGTGAAWGCHESYLTRHPPAAFSRALLPHLVSRILFTGCGGFNSLSPGLEFLVSPRVAHLCYAENHSSQHSRPIFHTRDEPLCGGAYHRLHVLCGESLNSHLSAWLKVAATALVVALIDEGRYPNPLPTLRDPVGAMRTFAADPTGRARALLADGTEASALDLQRLYLALAEEHQRDSFMPLWAPDACRHWRTVLQRLDQGPAAVATCLDWAIKWTLFREHTCRRGLDWDTLPAWSAVLRNLAAALAQGDPDEPAAVLVPPLVIEPSMVTPDVRRLVQLTAPRQGLDPEQLLPILALRQELCEIDWRFGQLGEGSAFLALDRAGLLDHRFDGVDNIDHALVNPPNFGRASLRGNCIRRLAFDPTRYAADWIAVFDVPARQVLDLSDPYAQEEHWLDLAATPGLPPAGARGREGLFYAALARMSRADDTSAYM